MESGSERKKVVGSYINWDKESPVTFKWNWGKDGLLIVDHYAYLGVESQQTALGMHT